MGRGEACGGLGRFCFGRLGYLKNPLGSVSKTWNLASDPPQTLGEAVLQTKRDFVVNVLELTGGNRKEAAVILGIHPKSMCRFLDRLDL